MNELEIKILNFIKNRGSFKQPVPLKKLKSEFNISERGVKEVVERLRCEFKQPSLQAVERDEVAIICRGTIWNAT